MRWSRGEGVTWPRFRAWSRPTASHASMIAPRTGLAWRLRHASYSTECGLGRYSVTVALEIVLAGRLELLLLL
jgi:hypothetical protein